MGLAALMADGAAAQSQRPNVLMIAVDDGGYADFGFMNQFTGRTTKFRTPRLDALAGESAVFRNSYVSGPLCSMSRAGLLTGRNSQRFGVEWNFGDTTDPNDGIPVEQTLMTERFKQLGYTTGVVGKWHIGHHESQLPHNQGVDEFFGVLHGTQYYFQQQGSVPTYRNQTQIAWQNEPSFNGVPNDPTNGRLFTDALGDEGSKFIANHADDADPFFLYMPFNAPHYPVNKSKASDAAPFYGLGMPVERHIVAALTLGLDRNIGQLLDRLDDPNRDGNNADSIRDNTIVIFTNDNGGPPALPNGVMTHDNGPLLGNKGSSYEGGIRVPMLIRAPGVAPQVVDEMVSTLDLFPTLVKAAGAAQTTQTDGVDIMPLLKGQQQGPVHAALMWRQRVDGFAIRKGEWKLVRGTSNAPVQLFRLNPDGTGEDVDLSSQFPEKVQELVRDYVHWEAQQDKLRNTAVWNLNRFDEFKQRNDISTEFNWLWANGWMDANNPATIRTIQKTDPSPETVLIFETRNDASYKSLNNVIRAAGPTAQHFATTPAGLYEFMLNEVRLQGSFGGSANRSGTLHGNPLLFVKSLDGRMARLSLDANKSAAGPNFTFNVNMDLILHDDLLVTGNGTGAFSVGGVIRDFDGPRALIKEGTSSLTLANHNTYAGPTIIESGELRLASAAAAIDGSSQVLVGAGATLTLSNGEISTNELVVEQGGALAFSGGTLETSRVVGNLVNGGGVFDAGLDPGAVGIAGNYKQVAGALHLDFGNTGSGIEFDRLSILGSAELSGALNVSATGPVTFSLGSFFPIISAVNGVTGQFTSLTAPSLGPGLQWDLEYTPNSVILQVVNLAGGVDYLSRWRHSFGVNAGGDLDQDGDTDGNDYLVWQRDFGAADGNISAIPEPSSVVLTLATLAGAARFCRGSRRSKA